MQQMSLSFEPGLSQRHRSLVECVATGVYSKGLGRIAAQLDVSPSHLSEQLSACVGDGKRRLPVETLELYIEKTHDLTPIYYLLDKFCRDQKVRQQEALARIPDLVEQLLAATALAGVPMKAAKR